MKHYLPKTRLTFGTRCTVFMNSSETGSAGAEVDDFSLTAIASKNAIFIWSRCSDASELGKHIVVQEEYSTTTPYCGALKRSLTAKPFVRILPGIMGVSGAAPLITVSVTLTGNAVQPCFPLKINAGIFYYYDKMQGCMNKPPLGRTIISAADVAPIKKIAVMYPKTENN